MELIIRKAGAGDIERLTALRQQQLQEEGAVPIPDISHSVGDYFTKAIADGSFVWRVEDGKSQRVPVKIVQRNSDKVLVDAALEKDQAVVMEGVQRLRDGGDVRIAGEEPKREKKPEGDGEQKVSEAEAAK